MRLSDVVRSHLGLCDAGDIDATESLDLRFGGTDVGAVALPEVCPVDETVSDFNVHDPSLLTRIERAFSSWFVWDSSSRILQRNPSITSI